MSHREFDRQVAQPKHRRTIHGRRHGIRPESERAHGRPGAARSTASRRLQRFHESSTKDSRWAGRKPRTYGVQLDVSHAGQEIRVRIDDRRPVSPLPKRAGSLISGIEAHGVIAYRLLHHPRHSTAVDRCCKDVHMIRHQDERVNRYAVSFSRYAQERQVRIPVLVVEKRWLAIVASLHEVLAGNRERRILADAARAGGCQGGADPTIVRMSDRSIGTRDEKGISSLVLSARPNSGAHVRPDAMASWRSISWYASPGSRRGSYPADAPPKGRRVRRR